MEENVPLAQLTRRLEEVVSELRGLPVDVERLEDGDDVRRRILEAASSAREVRAMHPVGPAEPERREHLTRRQNLDALERGIRMRTIVHADVLDNPRNAARIRQLHAAGDLHRVADEPIQQLIVFDRTVAFLQFTPVAYTPGALVIRQQSLITALIGLFEQTWARAREVTEPTHRLSSREREVLALIAQGRSNGAVARALSITEAAVGKHVASVFAKLEIPATADDNRRVLAVLAYLRGTAR
ncbi:helix-turn-helix transcriptional regulator [Nonomuraea gerenzanensis]|uniref:Putative two-component system response regulator n=1 Tax=Nonomuraea gerenzanensis TaxID=93944 RepID=A0A1M4EFS9_9ACTN|nr:LuxR family transcriptional regulator [Nonomuraea gerenzanensis]UBU09436.1 LuxR C-terminal-related transcriptional regulator [Nonomuraea gerenzanensis]SBO97851.1 putative two-component system response regulator [Nonomuraea gerenzanensis]